MAGETTAVPKPATTTTNNAASTVSPTGSASSTGTVQKAGSLGYGAGAAGLSPLGLPGLGLGGGYGSGLGGLPTVDSLALAKQQKEARQPILNWMNANTSRLALHSMGYIKAHVRANVVEALGKSDGDIELAAYDWSAANNVNIPTVSPLEPSGPPAAVAPSESVLAAKVKSAFTTAVDGVTVTKGAGSFNISVKGATAKLQVGGAEVSAGVSTTGEGSVGVKKGDTEVKATASFSGTLGLEASRGPVHFTGSIGADGWEMGLSFGSESVTPMMSQLGDIFSKGESAFRGIVGEAVKGGSISAIKGRVKPFVDPVGSAVDAAKAIADTAGVSVSAGISVGGGGDTGVHAVATLTIRF